jgi:osmotically-inducible protein OsmY
MRPILLLLLFLSMSACTSMLLAPASSGDGGTTADRRSDAQVSRDNAISASIRRNLSGDTLVGKYAIGIRTVDSIVTLSGTVGSYSARDRAVEIATNTVNVAPVRNGIVVNTNL